MVEKLDLRLSDSDNYIEMTKKTIRNAQKLKSHVV